MENKEKKQLRGFWIGDVVMTPHGKGKVSKFEEFRISERIAVELDENPFSFPLAYYFPNELKQIGSSQLKAGTGFSVHLKHGL